jgi:hypothetical protein
LSIQVGWHEKDFISGPRWNSLKTEASKRAGTLQDGNGLLDGEQAIQFLTSVKMSS